MVKLISILSFGILILNIHPIDSLKVNTPPSKEEVEKLNHSDDEYEVFLNDKGNVEYREYDYNRVKGEKLPFQIIPLKNDKSNFEGRQVNLKINGGWLVGFDKGEWGGGLFWLNNDGTKYEKIVSGNIKDIFQIDGEIFVTEGLAHGFSSTGQILKILNKRKKWKVRKLIELPNTPYSTTLTKENEFLIVTSKGLIKVSKELKIVTIVKEGFWDVYLYPNSILIEGQNIYIGMRGGILRTKIDKIENQEWLTK